MKKKGKQVIKKELKNYQTENYQSRVFKVQRKEAQHHEKPK